MDGEAGIVVRAPGPDDARAVEARLRAIFRDAVPGAAPDVFDAVHVAVRASGADDDAHDDARWASRLGDGETRVATDVAIGYAVLEAADYVDQPFVDPAFQRRDAPTRQLSTVEMRASTRGTVALTTHASPISQPLVRRHDHAVERWERVEYGDLVFPVAAMRKALR